MMIFHVANQKSTQKIYLYMTLRGRVAAHRLCD